MLRIRLVEERLAELYKEQEMKTPTHFSIGQEAVAVGVCEALTNEDVVYSGHRSHAQYLAKGGDLNGLVAELYGKESGTSGGRGGSVHLSALETGYIASSAILGETIATAVGSALSFDMDDASRVSACFFGDGAVDEGIMAESMNFASLRNLPVIFVCENNMYSLESPIEERFPTGVTIASRAEAYSIDAQVVDGSDAMAIYHATDRARELCLAGKGPVFLECQTYRWREHVGPNEDHEMGYRDLQELESWKARDPIAQLKNEMITSSFCTEDDLTRWTESTESEIDSAVTQAKAAPFPEITNLFDNVY
jgi:TPP-dependent pyruvate/acetoin dehydrogenase alpha subunit